MAPRTFSSPRPATHGSADREDRELIEHQLTRAQLTGGPFTFEARVMRFDGVERTIRARGRVERDADGDPARVIGAIQDVTDQVRVRAERELLSYVVESTDDAVITKSREGIITSWNHGAERLYGYSAQEAIGRPIGLIEPAAKRGEQQEILRKVFLGESVDRFETDRIRNDGAQITVSLTISPVKDANG